MSLITHISVAITTISNNTKSGLSRRKTFKNKKKGRHNGKTLNTDLLDAFRCDESDDDTDIDVKNEIHEDEIGLDFHVVGGKVQQPKSDAPPLAEKKEVKIEYLNKFEALDAKKFLSIWRDPKRRDTPNQILNSINEDRTMMGLPLYTEITFQKLGVTGGRKGVKQKMNDVRSKAIARKKKKVKEWKELEMATRARVEETRADNSLKTPHDWAKIMRIANEWGFLDYTGINSSLSRKERKAAQMKIKEDAYKRVRKALTRQNKKAKKERESITAQRKKRAQERYEKRKDNRLAKKERRRAKKNGKNSVPTEAGEFEFNVHAEEFYPVITDMVTASSEFADTVISEDTKRIISIVADTASFVRIVYVARDWKTVMSAFNLYLGALGVRGKLVEITTEAVKYLRTFFTIKSEKETEAWSDNIDAVKNSLHLIVNSALAKAVQNLTAAVLCYELVGSILPPKYNKYMPKIPSEITLTATLVLLLDSMSTIVGVAERIWSGMPICEALFAKDPYATFHKECNSLLAVKDHLYTGAKIDGFYSYDEWMKRVETNIAAGKHLRKSNFGTARESIDSRLRELERLKRDVTAKKAIERIMPFGLIVHGPPGQGKSYVTKHICKVYASVVGRTYSPELMFTKNPEDRFWQGYDPALNPIIFYPEIANIAPAKLKKEGDEVLAQVNRLMDRHQCRLNMAKADDKGDVLARPDLVVMETNKKDLNLDKGAIGNPNAIRRRFFWIEVRVKPEFMKHGSNTADSEKIDELPPTERMNVYNYSIMKYSFKNDIPTEEYIHITQLLDFNTWLKTHMLAHFDEQKGSMVSNTGATTMTRSEYEEQLCADEVNGVSDGDSLSEDDLFPEDIEEKAGLRPEEYHQLPTECDEPKEDEDAMFLEYLKQEQIRRDRELLAEHDLYDTESGNAEDVDLDEKQREEEVPDDADEKHQREWDERQEDARFRFANWIRHYCRFPNLFWNTIGRTVWLYKFIAEITTCLSVWFFYAWISTKLLIPTKARNWVLNSFWVACIFAPIGPFFAWIATFLGVGVGALLFDPIPDLYRSSQYNITRYRFLLRAATSNLWACLYRTSAAAVIGFSSIYIAIRLVRGALKVYDSKKTEASTFPMDERLRDFEKSHHMGEGYERIKTKIGAHWDNFKIPVTKPPVHRGTVDELKRAINKNLCYVAIEEGEGHNFVTRRSHILGLKSNIALINSHAVGPHTRSVRVKTRGGNEQTGYVDIKITTDNTYRLKNDLMLIRVSNMQFRDITKHFIDASQFDGLFWGSIEDEKTKGNTVRDITIRDKYNGSSDVDLACEYVFTSHEPGKCGIPLIISRGQGAVVAGIHCAGEKNTNKAFATVTDKKVLLDGIEAFEEKLSLMPLFSEAKSEDTFVMPLPKSPIWFIPLKGLEYYGKAEGSVMIQKKSTLAPTIFREDRVLDDLFYKHFGHVRKTVFGRPVMAPKTNSKGEYISPWNVGLEKMNTVAPSLDVKIMKTVVDRITSHILEKLGDVKITPLSFEAGINGVQGDPFIRRINASTAGGIGFPGVKKNYIPLYSGETRSMDVTLQNKLIKDIEDLQNDRLPFWSYKYALKDEPRDVEKVKTGKTRLFGVPPLDKLVLDRCFLSPFYSLMVEKSEVFSSAVGICMHKGAHAVVDAMREHPNVMEYDYSAYDQSMPCDVAHGVATVVANVCRALGYGPNESKIVRGLMTANIYIIADLNKDTFLKPGLQPSGKYATAEDNSLRNLFLLMYAWYEGPNKDKDFYEHVTPVTYGDDALVSVSDEVKDTFNNITYKDACERLYGMKITPAAKGDEMLPFVDASEMSFLKRRFVYSQKFSSWAGVLDLDSCYKALEWIKPSKHESRENQIMSTMTSVLWEIFIRCRDDKATFDAFRYDLVKAAEIHLGDIDSYIVTYEEIENRLYPRAIETEAGEIKGRTPFSEYVKRAQKIPTWCDYFMSVERFDVETTRVPAIIARGINYRAKEACERYLLMQRLIIICMLLVVLLFYFNDTRLSNTDCYLKADMVFREDVSLIGMNSSSTFEEVYYRLCGDRLAFL